MEASEAKYTALLKPSDFFPLWLPILMTFNKFHLDDIGSTKGATGTTYFIKYSCEDEIEHLNEPGIKVPVKFNLGFVNGLYSSHVDFIVEIHDGTFYVPIYSAYLKDFTDLFSIDRSFKGKLPKEYRSYRKYIAKYFKEKISPIYTQLTKMYDRQYLMSP
jgi:hypothetical protein